MQSGGEAVQRKTSDGESPFTEDIRKSDGKGGELTKLRAVAIQRSSPTGIGERN